MKKIILITGSTDGIGKLTAIKLANEGHTIYLHGRQEQKLADVISEIKETTQNEDIKGFVADFSDLKAVKKMAEKVSNELPQIDVLINNAGVFKTNVAQNADGLDLRMVVNYLAPYVFTNGVVPFLQKGENARVINLSSAAQSEVSIEVLLGKKQESAQETYAQSKLALTMWSFYMAKKVENIAVIPVNPASLLNTRMVKEAYGHHWSSADKGASILFDLAISNEYEGVSGKYFDNDRGTWGKAHPDAYDNNEINNLIKATNQLLIDKNVAEIV